MASKTLPAELLALTNFINEAPESLATGNPHIQAAALSATKFVFDLALQSESRSQPSVLKFLNSLSPQNAPLTRARAKAQREGEAQKQLLGPLSTFYPTPLTSLFVDGMEPEQVWQQLDLRGKMVCDVLRPVLGAVGFPLDDDGASSPEGAKHDDNDDDDGDDDGDDIVATFSSSEDGDEDGDDLTKLKFIEETEEASMNSPLGHARDREDDGDGDEDDETEDIDLFKPIDGFEHFDEEDLENGSTELYYQDFFDAAPKLTIRIPKPASQAQKSGHEESNSSGKVRFREEVRVKHIKSRGKGLSLWEDDDEDDDDDDDDYDHAEDGEGEGDGGADDGENDEDDRMEWNTGFAEDMEATTLAEDDASDSVGDAMDEDDVSAMGNDEPSGPDTIARFKDDLFADADQPAADGGLSTHEKRQAVLRAQIASLEAASVAPKKWTLLGEAGARARPHDALLAEDLEYERAGRATAPPLQTEAAVEGLEARIRARVLAAQWDDVVRPAAAALGAALARQRAVAAEPVLDTKSPVGLAQIYEGEYAAAQQQGRGGTVDDRDGQLKKEHEQIEALWEALCNKLDALCSAHFVPKPPKLVITTTPNAPTALLESALPSTHAARTTLLAPEEVYTAQRAAGSSSGGGGGVSRARSELTPGEARAAHVRKRRSRKTKAGAKVGVLGLGGKGKGKGNGRGEGREKEKEKAGRGVHPLRGGGGVGKGKGKGKAGQGRAR